MKLLPDVPSKLIRLALSDLEKVEKMKTVKVNMGEWHLPFNDVCYVCLAGSVMNRTLKVNKNLRRSPHDTEYSKELYAINYFRTGWVCKGLEELGFNNVDMKSFDRIIPEYKGKGIKFKKAMYKLADDLEKAGY